MDFLSCMLLFLFFGWFTIQAFHSFRRSRNKSIPPGPKPFPLVGNLFELGDKPHVSMTKLSQRYGPLMSLQLGQVTTIVVSSASMAKQILRTHDQFFCTRNIPDAVQVAQHGDYGMAWIPALGTWRSLRRICSSQLFSAKTLDANQAIRRLKVQELIDEVHKSMVEGKSVYIGRAAFRTSLNLLSRTIFSVDLADPNSEMAREFMAMVWGMLEDAGKPNLGDYFPLLRKFDPQGIRRRMTNHFSKMIQLFDRIIIQRLESRKEGDYVTTNDMLDNLLNLSDQERSEEVGMPEIIHLLIDLFVAGTDTTSATLEWAMAELLRNPESLLKAQAELKQIIGRGNPVEESDITRLPYLQAIIKETLRFHPVGPLLLPRKAEVDVEICGYVVPKGAQILVNAWAIGRDPSVWDNPNSFMPERFLGLDQIDVTSRNFEFIPFGGGRRICPGLPLAMRMLHLMLGSLLNSFDWELEYGVVPETMNMEDKFGLALHLAQPLRAVPKL